MGWDILAKGDYSAALGKGTTANIGQFVIGSYNVAQGDSYSAFDTDNAFIIGNGSADGSRSNAFAVQRNGLVNIFTIGNATPAIFLDPRSPGPKVKVGTGSNAIELDASVPQIKVGTSTAVTSNASGNVGLGVTSPVEKLDIAGNARLSNVGSNGNGYLAYTSGNAHVFSLTRQSSPAASSLSVSAAGALGFSAGASTPVTSAYQMILTTGGNLGVGTTDPKAKLHLSKDGTVPAAALFDAADALLVSNAAASTSARFVTASSTAPDAAVLGGLRSRGTLASPTVVQSGDSILRILGQGYDGSSRRATAQVSVEVDGTPGASDMPGRIVFSTTPDGSATLAERMRITNGGNVGIGTINPDSRLGVSGQTKVSGNFYVDTGAYAEVAVGTHVRLRAGGNELLYGNATGNVGIGTTTPSVKLEVNGGAKFSGAVQVTAQGDVGMGVFAPPAP